MCLGSYALYFFIICSYDIKLEWFFPCSFHRTCLFYTKEKRTYEMQLQHIFNIRGLPSTTEWPEFHEARMKFEVTKGQKLVDLHENFKNSSKDLQVVMEKLVCLSPHDRWGAETITLLKFFGNFGKLPKNVQLN